MACTNEEVFHGTCHSFFLQFVENEFIDCVITQKRQPEKTAFFVL